MPSNGRYANGKRVRWKRTAGATPWEFESPTYRVPYKNAEDKKAYMKKFREEHETPESKRRLMVRKIKSQPCMDCKLSFPYYVMHFDHVRGIKLGNINTLVKVASMEKLVAEIAKCEIICANCHAIRTYNRLMEAPIGVVHRLESG